MKLRLHTFDLPLKRPFTISRGTVTVQPTLVVELSDGSHRGFGEATENEYYGFSIASMTRSLENAREQIEAYPLDDADGDWPARFWRDLRPRLADDPFASCALDQAAYDLWGKRQGQPVYKLWGLTADDLPPTNYTIGIDSIDLMIEKLREAPGFPVYKIKLGTPEDLEIVRRLREHTEARFRVDANCAWGVDETIRNSQALKDLNVEFIEQPMDPADWDGMKAVYADSALPLIADESCIEEPDVARCHGYFHGVNVKLVKCGGLTPARRMIDQARSLGMETMVGCMTESTVGASAIAQLLPLLDYVDMDGPLLLARDIATGVTFAGGHVHYADENGCGVRLL